MDNEKEIRECSGWCWPLYIHIAISVLQLVFIMSMKGYNKKAKRVESLTLNTKYKYALFSIIWNTFIGVIMYYLCKSCHSGWAWFILLLPIILNILFFVILAIAVSYALGTLATSASSAVDQIGGAIADRIRPASIERHDHRCGPFFEDAQCDPGRCCSEFGWCGTGSEYCGEGLHGDGQYAWHTLV